MIVHHHPMSPIYLKIKSTPSFSFLLKSYLFFLSTLINDDSDDDDNEQKVLHNRHGPRTRNELAVDDLPPIENLTITLSDETPIQRIGHIRHIIDGKLVIIESLIHSPALNDDSVIFNSNRRSIGLIFETFGPVEKPYYSIRYTDIDNIHQRQIELNQEVFYAPKETTYTKYVFVQELRALKGSDASWEDDNEPPKFAIDYSDDEQERAAKAIQRGRKHMEETTNEEMMDATNNDINKYRKVFFKIKLIRLLIHFFL
jgi:H/ACA ribonucleoprotein complex non-core subunit NAF1